MMASKIKHKKNYLGKIAEAMIRNSLLYLENQWGGKFYWSRFYDTADFHKFTCPKCGEVMFSNLIIQHQPADYWAALQGKVVLIEVKSSSNAKYYNTKWVRERQISSLTRVANAGIPAVVIFIHLYGLGHPARAFMYSIYQFLDLIEKDERQSIPWEVLEENGTELGSFYYEIGNGAAKRRRHIYDLSILWKS